MCDMARRIGNCQQSADNKRKEFLSRLPGDPPICLHLYDINGNVSLLYHSPNDSHGLIAAGCDTNDFHSLDSSMHLCLD